MNAVLKPYSYGVPRFFLYGEPLRQPGERFVHIELIEDRSRSNDWTISPHIHPDLHHLLLVLEGSAEVHADEALRAYTSPALLVIPAGVVHAFQFRPETVGYVITVSDAFVGSLRAQDESFGRLFAMARGFPTTRDEIERCKLQPSAEALLEELRSSESDTMLLSARAQIFMAQAARLTHAHELEQLPVGGCTDPRADGTVEVFRKLIERHFRDNWSLQRYADEMCISVAHLRATCIKVTGSTSIKLLHERIIREAKRQLAFTIRPVAQIAYDLGFGDSAYFSRFFRARVGVTPSEFRRSLRVAHYASKVGTGMQLSAIA
jgi:AraC family transcriptional activator of pobA